MDQTRVIIVGAGEVGFHIARRLSRENKHVVVIDQKLDALRRLAESTDVQTIQGSGSSPKVLDQAGIHEADILLAVTDSDETNIIACFFANLLSPDVLKLARIRNEEYTLYRDAFSKDLLNIGVVINPEVEIVKVIDRMITVPGAVEYNEFAGGKIKMVGIRVEASGFEDVTLMDLRNHVPKVDFVIGAIVRGEEVIVPTGRDKIKSGDLIYFVCEQKDLDALSSAFCRSCKRARNVLVIGGGNIGFRLASHFENRGYHVKLVDKDQKRCRHLAEKLDRTIVLNGDGTDQEFLREENIDGMDVVVSLTGDEETNILTSLLAKNLGAAKTITRINKTAYLPLVRAIGIEHSVSPRLAAVNSILHNVRRGKVLSTVSIKGEEAEAMEAIAQENSSIVGRPIRDMDFPKGALLLCIMRGDQVMIPTGDSIIQPQDRIIILAVRKAISQVEESLTVKLEYF